MTSLLTSVKQIPANAGYYIPVGDCRGKFYQNNGTNDAPSFGVNSSVPSSLSTLLTVGAGGGVMRDHGLTLVSSSQVFRKVQLMVPNGSVLNNGTDGVYQVPGTSNPVLYLTGFIELPGQGTGSGSTFTPVARLG